jgi:FkbM family methyltransferase
MASFYQKILRMARGAISQRADSGHSSRDQTSAAIVYDCSGIQIRLPPGHLLPTYQSANRLYDRFLPHFVKYLSQGDVVIDVGANCGDTLAAMFASNAKLRYACVEPDDSFFEYLTSNSRILQERDPGAEIVLLKKLVGKSVVNASLAGQGGTKGAQVLNTNDHALHAEVHRSATLDAIVQHELPAAWANRIRLLKSDVDAYDYDVIDSATSILANQSPILFFECYYVTDSQRAGYLTTLSRLPAGGYSDFWVFDNFGNLILHTTQMSAVVQLIDYVWRQNLGASTRTVYYLDILACTSRDNQLAAKAVSDFVAPLGKPK